MDELPVVAAAILLTVLVFFLYAWILNRNFYEKLPKRVCSVFTGGLAIGLTGTGLFLLDQSELLVAMLDEEVQEDLRVNRNLGVYKGALYENVVGEALVKAGYDLYYFKKENSTLEEDFFVRTAEALVPVEVKASNNRSKSLRTLIDSEHYPDIHFGIKLAGTNIGYGNGVYTFPYFCSFLLKEYLRGFQHLENQS